MSGPKGISYAVDAAVLARLRRREESVADLRAADSRLQGLITRCDDLDLSRIVPSGLRGGTEYIGEELPTEVLEARALKIGNSVQDLSRRLEDTLADRQRKSLNASLAALAAQLPPLAGSGAREDKIQQPAAPVAQAPGPPEPSTDDKRTRVEEILVTLKMPPGELIVLANAAISAKPIRHESLLRQLRRDVRTANELYDRAAAASRESLGLAGQLDGELPPDLVAVQSLPTRIDEAGYTHALLRDVTEAEQSVSGGRKQAGQVRSAREAERARRHVEDAVKESFAALGYAVTDLEPTIVGGMVLSGPASDEYGIQVAIEGSEIAVRSVRIDGTGDGTMDRAADEELCDSVAALAPLLDAAGVTVGRIRSVPPGVIPVPAVSGGKATSAGAARAAAGTSASRRRQPKQRIGKTL